MLVLLSFNQVNDQGWKKSPIFISEEGAIVLSKLLLFFAYLSFKFE